MALTENGDSLHVLRLDVEFPTHEHRVAVVVDVQDGEWQIWLGGLGLFEVFDAGEGLYAELDAGRYQRMVTRSEFRIGFDSGWWKKTYLLGTVGAIANQPRHAVGLVREVLCEHSIHELWSIVFEHMLEIQRDFFGGLVAEALGSVLACEGCRSEGEENGNQNENGRREHG
jgi:hypothetical protein